MELESKHNYLRRKLDVLGYSHSLPLSAINLVSSILEDLIKTSEGLKNAKELAAQLSEVSELQKLEISILYFFCPHTQKLHFVLSSLIIQGNQKNRYFGGNFFLRAINQGFPIFPVLNFTFCFQEKAAWELGTEPYKCDNSKLLMECNRLKLELLNSQKEIQLENAGESHFI